MRFSVVVPIYNVAGFIERGMKELLKQDYQEAWEIILVDDGSTDGSTDIIDRIAFANPRVRVYHQPNSGAGAARNTGIDNAVGEYICFYDIDDKIESSLLSRLDRALLKANNPDMAVFGYDETDLKESYLFERVFPALDLRTNLQVRDNWKQYLSGIIGGNNGFVWNKTYRRDFLNRFQLRFENQRIQQDEVFNLKVYAKVDTLTLVPEILYHYIVYSSHNTRSHYIPNRLEIYKSVMTAFRLLLDEWRLSDTIIDSWLAKRFFRNIVYTLNYNSFHYESKIKSAERRKEILSILMDSDVQTVAKSVQSSEISFMERLYRLAIRKKSVFLFSTIRQLDLLKCKIMRYG